MRKIEFIAPVEAMRGKLSGDEPKLQYAENNNPAFDAPDGRQYAKNYAPKYIGAKRSSDGLKYFSVKTKSATLIDSASKRRMALLGAAGACVAYILKPGNMSVVNVLAPLNAHYEHAKSTEGFKGTLRKYVFETVYAALAAGNDFVWPKIVLSPGTVIQEITLISRFSGSLAEEEARIVNISDALVIKFWPYLVQNGKLFTILQGTEEDGQFKLSKKNTGVMIAGQSFGDIIEGAANILNLASDEQDNVVMVISESNVLPVWTAIGTTGVDVGTLVSETTTYYAAPVEP